MILGRILDPRSKLATARSFGSETPTHTLGEELQISDADENELYRAMDWLLERQDRIQRRLAAEHLEDGTLVLCDVTSVYFEGSKCPLAKSFPSIKSQVFVMLDDASVSERRIEWLFARRIRYAQGA